MPSRSRVQSRQVVARYGYKAVAVVPGGWSGSDSGTFNQSYESSSISDFVGNRQGLNPVRHTRRTIMPASVVLPTTLSKDKSNYSTEWHENNITTFGALGVEYGSPNLDQAWTELLADATGEMPLQASLVVNTVEFATLKDLIPGLLQAFTGIRKHKLTRRSLKDLAGSHLAYSFGLAPLVQDFKGFLGTRDSIQARIKELTARNGKTVRLAKRVSFSGKGDVNFSFRPGNLNFSGTGITSGTTKGVATVSADVTSFFVPDGESQCKMWSSALGLSSPLSNIWELIPFSFVIDWFLPIGKTFQLVERKLGMHETVRSLSITNICQSVKRETSYSTICTAKSTNYPGWNNLKFTGIGGVYTSYTRSPCGPLGYGVAAPSGWSLNRTALSASLIAQLTIK